VAEQWKDTYLLKMLGWIHSMPLSCLLGFEIIWCKVGVSIPPDDSILILSFRLVSIHLVLPCPEIREERTNP